jgi:hypothetical protein
MWRLVVLLLGIVLVSLAADLPPGLPALANNEPPADWSPLDVPRDGYLDPIEALCRFAAKHQNASGAIIDPLLEREHQYSTPYFAFAVGALLKAGRAEDLRSAGVRAMDHATASFAKGADGIPDRHGEFFIAPLTGALELYEPFVSEETARRWRERMSTPLLRVIDGLNEHRNNWRTYAMKGEWMRAEAGLADRAEAARFIQHAWLSVNQRVRIAYDKWNLYQDWSSDPNPHGVEAVGRGNLLAMLSHGYDGPFHEEMWRFVERGTRTSLLLQSPDGQCPPNGRTDNHVWNDVLYGLIFEVMAEREWQRGNAELAGQYRRAAMLALKSMERWRRSDPPWNGFFSITKNFFPPSERVGHQPASQVGNYSGAVMYHLAEAWLTRRSDIPERPTPAEVGGYAFATDVAFGSVVANAGGMQMFANLRGEAWPKYDLHWSALGVVRFAKAGWDSRLGPSDGVYDLARGVGVTFAPSWLEDGKWLRMAEQFERYEARFEALSAEPDEVRCQLRYAPRAGKAGPEFLHDFTITPERITARLTAEGAVKFGASWPLLVDDGRSLEVEVTERGATVGYPGAGDRQTFRTPQDGARLVKEELRVRSTYGWLESVRAEAVDGVQVTVVEPR